MSLRRQRVKLRKSYVRYRFQNTMRSAANWTLRLAAVAALVWLGFFVKTTWNTAHWLRVRRVEVDATAPTGLAAQVGLKAGDHLFRFSAKAVEAKLEYAFPELSAVRVRRWPDGAVKVGVKWRVPVARVADGDGWRGIDETGAVFSLATGAAAKVPPESLPVYVGGAGPAAMPYLDFIGSLHGESAAWAKGLRKLKALPAGEAVIFIGQETPVYWGAVGEDADRFRTKCARLARVLEDETLANGAVYIRFVTEDRLVAKPLAQALPAAKART